MKWFKKKNKEPKIFVSYIPLDSVIYLKATRPDRLAEVSPNSVFPFFIKLLEAPFENWVIELTGITDGGSGKVTFGTLIDLIPKTVDERTLEKLQPQLKVLLTDIINDIMSDALGRAEKDITKHQKKK